MDRRHLLLVGAVLLGWMPLFSLWLNPPVLTGDEAYYARVPVEMRERGDWIVPYFNGEPRYKKPPLMYWLVALSQSVFGENEVSSRLPSLVAVFLTGFLLFWFGRKFNLAETGAWAAAIFLLNPMTAILGNWGAPEATLCLFVTASIIFGLVGMNGEASRLWLPLSGASAGLGILTKGAPGIILPVVVLFPLAVLKLLPQQGELRSWSVWGKFAVQWGLWFSACLTIAAPWFVAVGLREGEAFWQVFLFREHVRRVVEPMEGHSGPLWFYLAVVWVLFLPWSVRLPYAIAATLKPLRRTPIEERQQPFGLPMLWWSVSIVALFSAISTKLPHYIFPAFPALAWLCALQMREDATKGEFVLGLLIATLPVLGALYAASVIPNNVYSELLRKSGFEPGRELEILRFALNLIVFGFMSVTAGWLCATLLPLRKYSLLFSGAVLVLVILKSASCILAASGGRDAVDVWAKHERIATFGSDTEWAVFYAKRTVPLLGRNRQKLREFLTKNPDAAILSSVIFAPELRDEGLKLVRFGFWCVGFRNERK